MSKSTTSNWAHVLKSGSSQSKATQNTPTAMGKSNAVSVAGHETASESLGGGLGGWLLAPVPLTEEEVD